jgi:hypothetical protein
MTRQTTVSLFAAVAFGVIVAAATAASGETRQGGPVQTQNHYCATATWRACMASCAAPGLSPEQRAGCEEQCFEREDVMDCMYVRPSPTGAATNAVQRATPRRR